MKRALVITGIALAVFGGIFIFYYLENSEEPEAVPANGPAQERAYYDRAEKALSLWEKAGKKNEIERALAELREKNIGKLKAENPYVANMLEGAGTAKPGLPAEIETGAEKKKLIRADLFTCAGRQFYAAHYRGVKEKELRYYEDTDKGLVEIKLEGMLPAALYGFKTIMFSKNDIPVLVAMMFASDDSWSTRNFYMIGAEGRFEKIYSFEGSWVEERYADLDGDGILEIILQRRLNTAPEGAAEIIKELKAKNLSGYNAIFYEHEIIKWDPKNKKMVKAGAIIKADFSHKE